MEIDQLKLRSLLDFIDPFNNAQCLRLYEENKVIFHKSPGSKTKHQAWHGGFVDHLEEVMKFAFKLFNLMNAQRPLVFSLSDAMLVLFLHDIEKPFKYGGSKIPLNTEEEKWNFLIEITNRYGIDLSEEHLNALRYAHGEGKDYDPIKRVQGPLGAFIHMCDVASARIWYDYPKKTWS
jgi:hypothetical protein